jgi:hypothetical protein
MPRFLFEDTVRSPPESGPLDASSVGILPGNRLIRDRTNQAGERRPPAVETNADALSSDLRQQEFRPDLANVPTAEGSRQLPADSHQIVSSWRSC